MISTHFYFSLRQSFVGVADRRCPEWPQDEIIDLIALDLKVAGFVAIVSIIYLLGALIVGLLVKNNLKDYKSDYI